MRIHQIELTDINVGKTRQRREFDATKLLELAGSIAQNGLIHPIVVRKDEEGQIVLVAGERRLRALEYCWEYGDEVRCGDHVFPERLVPCLYMGELDPVDAFEVELEENVRRTDLSWKEVSSARAQLMALRTMQAERNGTDLPTVAKIVEEVSDAKDIQASYVEVRQDLILARHLDDPDIAGARSRKEAFTILKRKEERQKNAELAEKLGPTFNSSVHRLLQGDCLEILPTLQDEFDVILTDPPYGIGADEFGDSGGRTGTHYYGDSYEEWVGLMEKLLPELTRVTKLQAHLYIFCDVTRFVELKELAMLAGWRTFRTPLIWFNPTSMRAPWPEHGPQRKYQCIMYAVKGDKPVQRLYGDVIMVPSDPNIGHAAQKPVALYEDLLRRSVRPGDSVLDPFAGSGTLYPACHSAKCRATGIELDPSAAGLAAKRLEELK